MPSNSANIYAKRLTSSGLGVVSRQQLNLTSSSVLTDMIVAGFIGKIFYFKNNSGTSGMSKIINAVRIDSYNFTVFLEDRIAYDMSFTWKICNMPSTAKRILDYKIQIDSKNYYYFSESTEWVFYHSFNEESYYGNRFYPVLGHVICYDENDQEIIPSDILYYPGTIKDGSFEGAKVIIQWAGKMSGKACFNPCFTADEQYDQSRLILNISRYQMEASGNAYRIGGTYNQSGLTGINYANVERTHRSTGVVTTEPYMTVDAVSNGKMIEYKLISDSDAIYHKSKVRIKSDIAYHKELDRLIHSGEKNPDILNCAIFESNTLSDLMDWTQFFGYTIGTGAHSGRSSLRYLSTSAYYTGTYISFDLPTAEPYPDGFAVIDNIGFSYNSEDPNYKYRIYVYIHSKRYTTSEFIGWCWATLGLPYNTYRPGGNMVIKDGEYYTPLLKIPGMNGYAKLIKRQDANPTVTSDGKYEADYILEFPSCIGTAQVRQDLTLWDGDYVPGQIFFPTSYIKAGARTAEINEREELDWDRLFTHNSLFMSDFESTTYRRNYGGGVKPANILRRDAIEYPSNCVYRKIIPNEIKFLNNSGSISMNVEILSGMSGGYSAIPPNFDMKLMIYYSNKKWKYNQDKYESYSGRENPSYVFEIDANTMMNDYSQNFKTSPSLPDIKRWFTAYCRGYAKTGWHVDMSRIASADSHSEQVLDVWDNHLANWRSMTPAAFDMFRETGAVYINDYRNFQFGMDKVSQTTNKSKKYFDFRSSVSPEVTFEFDGALQYVGDIPPNTGNMTLTLNGFSSGTGVVGGQCIFNYAINPNPYLSIGDSWALDPEASWTMCYKVKLGNGERFTPLKIGSTRFSIIRNDGAPSTFKLYAGSAASSDQIVLGPSSLTDYFYIMIVKNGTVFTMTAYYSTYINDVKTLGIVQDITGSVTATIGEKLFSTTQAYLDKFYVFNKPVSYIDFNHYINGYTDTSDFARYVDDDGKIRFRYRIFRYTPYGIRKFTKDTDRLVQARPEWSTGEISWIGMREENIRVIGLDYFRAESV